MAAAGGLREMTDQKPDDVRAREEARWVDRATTFFTQVNEAAIKTGESTFQACLLINGGAAISVLAFIGGLASKDVIGVAQLAVVADSLIAFAGGVLAAVAGMALSYLVHYFTAVHTDSLIQRGERTVLFGRLKNGLHVLAILPRSPRSSFSSAGSLLSVTRSSAFRRPRTLRLLARSQVRSESYSDVILRLAGHA